VLAVESGSDLYALPLVNILEARRAADENAVIIDGRTYFPQNREMLPVFDLGALLGRAQTEPGGCCLFIRLQDQRFILKAPNVLGSRRVTARPSPSSLKVPGLIGACADSGGRIYFLLSPEQLLKLAGNAGRPVDRKNQEAKA